MFVGCSRQSAPDGAPRESNMKGKSCYREEGNLDNKGYLPHQNLIPQNSLCGVSVPIIICQGRQVVNYITLANVEIERNGRMEKAPVRE